MDKHNKSNPSKSSKQNNAKKKATKFIYEGNISVIIDDNKASSEALNSYIKRLSASLNIQCFYIISSNESTTFNATEDPNYTLVVTKTVAAAVDTAPAAPAADTRRAAAAPPPSLDPIDQHSACPRACKLHCTWGSRTFQPPP